MKLESGFVPVALSSHIEPGTSTGAVVEGFELVVWRDTSGKVHVWEDRCPHRGMRLSFGFVRGDHIACLYHGWQFDTGGQCRYIPAHPDLDVPQTIKVPTYRAAETLGIVWATRDPDAALPDIAVAADLVGLRSLSVDCSLDTVLAGLEARGYIDVAGNVGTIAVGGTPLLVALQAVGPQATALHISVPGTTVAATSKRLARWAEELRFALETPDLAEAEVA